MMNTDRMKFTAIRSVKLLFRLFLEIFDELKVASEINHNKLQLTFSEVEEFLKKEHNISVNLQSFLKYSNVIDEDKCKQIRKRILDYGNSLIREIETQR